MKYKVTIIENLKETLVNIKTNKIDEEVEELINYLENTDKIVGYRDGEIKLLDIKNVVRFYSSERKVYAKINKEQYNLKLKLYQLEQLLSENFIKISQSEFANIKKIKKLNFSTFNSVEIVYANGDIGYVARRKLKQLKSRLGV